MVTRIMTVRIWGAGLLMLLVFQTTAHADFGRHRSRHYWVPGHAGQWSENWQWIPGHEAWDFFY